MKHLITLLLVLSLASISWSQDVVESADTETDINETSVTNDEIEDADDSDLDEQGYGTEEEEDDFIPSQEVSADQSLPFPVDI